MSLFMLELPACLQKWLAFNVSYRSAYFDNGNFCIRCCRVAVETVFDFVGNVRVT